MSNRPVKVIAGIACATAVVAAGAFGVTAANADPLSSNQSSIVTPTYVAVGSDTIQSLYDAFANGYTDLSGTAHAPLSPSIASWLATGSSNIIPSNVAVPSGAGSIVRPGNSGDGRVALSAAWNPASNAGVIAGANGGTATSVVTPGSIDIARSSGKPSTIVPSTAQNANLVSIPLGRDAVSVAVNDVPALDDALTVHSLAALYLAPDSASTGPDTQGGNYFATGSSETPTVGDVKNTGTATAPVESVYGSDNAWHTVQPYLPANSGSGTRQFFQTAIGLTKTSAPSAGVKTKTDSGANIIENTGDLVSHPGDIAPFSAAQWISQKNGLVSNTVSNSAIHLVNLGGKNPVNGTAPALTPASGPTGLYGDLSAAATSGVGIFSRDVYSVAAVSEFTAQSALQTLLTVTEPSSPYVTAFGFGDIHAVAAVSSNWIYSPFENTASAPTVATTTSLQVTNAGNGTVALTATVAAPAGYQATAGTVTFKNGSTTLGTATSNGAGIATWSGAVPAGAHSFTAAYAGAAASLPSAFAASVSPAVAFTTAAAHTTPSVVVSKVTVSGTAKVGSTLTAKPSSTTHGVAFSYQWYAGTAAISGANSSKLVVPGSAKGKTLKVKVTGTAAGAISASATSAATKAAAAGTLKGAAATIVGTAKVGQTLVAVNSSTWTTGAKVKFQWLSNGKSIKGATKQTLKLSASLKGKKISVKVTGSLTGYTALAKVSKVTKAVAK